MSAPDLPDDGAGGAADEAGSSAFRSLDFQPLFDLRAEEHPRIPEGVGVQQPDRRDGVVYELAPALHLAVEVALTTGRPLLLRGDPGTGKSSLAPYVARRLGWRYYEQVITSETGATDLLWRFDAVRRLSDAQVPGRLQADEHYLEPGPLWWAYDRASALRRGGPGGLAAVEPLADVNRHRDPDRAVVLLDEIDKAHPDLPNGLLVALGSSRFAVPQLGISIEREVDAGRREAGAAVASVLVVVTTNEERELPPAFVRRCVTFRLDHPAAADLVRMAARHFDHTDHPFGPEDHELAAALARRLEELRAQTPPGVRKPSTAEFLDAFRACRARGVRPAPDDPVWEVIQQLTLAKPDQAPW